MRHIRWLDWEFALSRRMARAKQPRGVTVEASCDPVACGGRCVFPGGMAVKASLGSRHEVRPRSKRPGPVGSSERSAVSIHTLCWVASGGRRLAWSARSISHGSTFSISSWAALAVRGPTPTTYRAASSNARAWLTCGIEASSQVARDGHTGSGRLLFLAMAKPCSASPRLHVNSCGPCGSLGWGGGSRAGNAALEACSGGGVGCNAGDNGDFEGWCL
mmetsp:Transcript_9731/g.24873  ORF Transcript_9731/g.24873 Transcript_9731/m.24873 type:complete len:218 (-) Transcript_9731:375-1028(-)